MKLTLQIAGLNILISDYPFSEIQNVVRPFVREFAEDKADILCSVNTYDVPPEISGEFILTKSNRKFYRAKNDLWFVYKLPYKGGEMTYYTIFCPKTNQCQILMPQNYMEAYFDEKLFLELLVFNFLILNYSRIMMHASVIEYNSEAILFSGPSGIGKSTQADLWKEYKNADILNGDRGILHIGENSIEVHGSPFAGSSKIYRNISAPVKAIVLLEQSCENKIEKLSPQIAYKSLYPRFAIPNWDMEWTLECVTMIEKLMRILPIYKMSCTPDKRAVELLHDTLNCD